MRLTYLLLLSLLSFSIRFLSMTPLFRSTPKESFDMWLQYIKTFGKPNLTRRVSYILSLGQKLSENPNYLYVASLYLLHVSSAKY